MRRNVSKQTLAVFGASGATGRAIVAEAREAGHEVVAFVRRPGCFETTVGLREVVWADVTDSAPLAGALGGVDVAISALGGAGNGPTTVCTDAVRSIIPAMTAAGVRRLIVVSAHGVRETHDRSLYVRAVWAGVAEKMVDKESMEALIVGSPLEWTIVRPPALRNTAPTGRYSVDENLRIRLWHFIGRRDLAAFLVREAEHPRFVRGYPRIRR